jgi:hypothetical protein
VVSQNAISDSVHMRTSTCPGIAQRRRASVSCASSSHSWRQNRDPKALCQDKKCSFGHVCTMSLHCMPQKWLGLPVPVCQSQSASPRRHQRSCGGVLPPDRRPDEPPGNPHPNNPDRRTWIGKIPEKSRISGPYSRQDDSGYHLLPPPASFR